MIKQMKQKNTLLQLVCHVVEKHKYSVYCYLLLIRVHLWEINPYR